MSPQAMPQKPAANLTRVLLGSRPLWSLPLPLCVLVLFTLVAASGCDGVTGGDGAVGGSTGSGMGTVEMFSWWTSGGEREALSAVIDEHESRIPGATVVNAAVEFKDKARDQLRQRMHNGLPPDLFQANVGAGLVEWVVTNGVDDSDTKVESLQKLAESEGWLDVFHPDVLRAASFDGKLYGLPVNVHRINSLFYNKQLMDRYLPMTDRFDVPEDIDSVGDLLEFCQVVWDSELQPTGGQAGAGGASSNAGVSCLGLGNKWEWTLEMLVFEMILPAIAGGEYYESFWKGERSGNDPEILETLDWALRFYCGPDSSECAAPGYFNADVDDVTWDEAVGKLAQGKVVLAPMGDWAKGLLESEGLKPDEDFGVIPFPGSKGTFVFTADAFPLPDGASNRSAAIEFLKTFASIEGQVAFNRKKGSISPRGDVDPGDFDAMTQKVKRDFERGQRAMALSGLLPSDIMPDLKSELKASLRLGSTEIIRNYVRANYEALGH